MVMGVDDWIARYTIGTAAGVASSGATGLLGGGFRALNQLGGIAIPNVMPPLPMLMQAYYQGKMSRPAFNVASLAHGIDFTGATYGPYWRDVLAALKPPTPLQVVSQLYTGDKIDYDQLREHFRRNNVVDDDAIEQARESFGAPPWQWCLAQRRLGQIDDVLWSMLCRIHAIGKDNYRELWETSTSPLSVQDALDLWLRGLLSSDRASQHVAAGGIIANPDNAAIFQRAQWRGIPSVNVLLKLVRLGMIDQKAFDDFCLYAGYKNDLSLLIASQESNTFAPSQAMDLLNRGVISEQDADRHLLAGGFVAIADKVAIKQLRFHNPTVSDAIRYQRAADANAAATSKLKLHTEYPDSVAQAATRTGWDQNTINIGFGADGPALTSPAKAEWVAHWTLPSPIEAMQMKLHLTEMRVQQLRAAGLSVEQIDDDELNGILQGAAVPPGWRDYVKASQYRQIPLREIVRIARFTKLSHDQIKDRFLQLGYVPDDAERMALAIEAYIFQQENRPIQAEVNRVFTERIKAVRDGYEVGYIDLPTAVNTYVGMGFTRQQAGDILQLVNLDRNHKLAVQGLKAIEQAYARGELNPQGTIAALTKIGIVNDVAQVYLKQWTITHTTHLKHSSTTEILRWLEEGIITAQQAETRLANMGWTSPDILAMISDARRKQAQMSAQASAAMARDRKQRANELLSVAKQAKAAHNAAVAAMKRAAGIKTLMRWWIENVISEAEVEERGQLIGYTLSDIHNYMNDALIAQSNREAKKANAKTAKSSAAGTSPATT